jgi:hypothetical protein
MKRILTICIGIFYASALMAGCGASKEQPDIRIEATLYQKSEQNGQDDIQLSYDFDDYHPDDKKGYARDEAKHTFSNWSASNIKLDGTTTIQGQSAKIVYYVYLHDQVFRDQAERAEIKVNADPKRFYLNAQYYALLCAKTVEPDKK